MILESNRPERVSILYLDLNLCKLETLRHCYFLSFSPICESQSHNHVIFSHVRKY
jgi:hypothetical protein